jgi:ACS family hexuronate transporter-like MFS transporter
MQAGWRLPKARKFVMLLGGAIMPVAILAPMVPTAALAIAAICFVTAGHALWISNLQALPTDICRANEIGTVMGISGMGGTVGGVLANFGTAWVVQHFTYAPIFAMAGLMHPLGVGIIYWLLPNWRFGQRAGVQY